MLRETKICLDGSLSVQWKVATPNPIFKAASDARKSFQPSLPHYMDISVLDQNKRTSLVPPSGAFSSYDPNWSYIKNLPVTDREIRFHTLPFDWKQQSILSSGASKAIPKRCLLPPLRNDREFTLVLDLDELLIHYEADSKGGGRIHTRPNLRWFLQTVSEHFEVVVYSTSTQSYCDFILDQIDSGKWITHRLYKNHLTLSADGTLKRDLTVLGREHSKTFSVTSTDVSMRLDVSKQNPLTVPAWFGDTRDRELSNLAETLSGLLKKKCTENILRHGNN